jgi:hypothetical protein
MSQTHLYQSGTIDNSEPPFTAPELLHLEMERLGQNYKTREALKSEIQRLRKPLENLETWIRLKEIKYLPGPPNITPH